MRLKSKNIILTGASRGFGRYLAKALWDEGANLLLVARDIHRLCTLTDLLPNRYDQSALILQADLSKPFIERGILSFANDRWSHVDGLVNNAAIQGPIGLSWTTNWDDWQDTIGVDLLTPVALCRQVVPGMLDRGKGKIVNLSGGGATSARPNFSAYATAKAGLVKFSECLAAELANTGIDVNCVAPGKMSTEMLSEIIKAGPQLAGEREYQQACMTAPETTMQKAAELIVWLLSDESNGITGRLFAAQWDDWRNIQKDDLLPDEYTLRRLTPAEDPRGL